MNKAKKLAEKNNLIAKVDKSKKLGGKDYFITKATNILKDNGLKLVSINDNIIIIPIKSFNLAVKDFVKKTDMEGSAFKEYYEQQVNQRKEIKTKVGTIHPGVENFSNDLDIYNKYVTEQRKKSANFIRSLHKERYWNLLPPSYVDIITKNHNSIPDVNFELANANTKDLMNKLQQSLMPTKSKDDTASLKHGTAPSQPMGDEEYFKHVMESMGFDTSKTDNSENTNTINHATESTNLDTSKTDNSENVTKDTTNTTNTTNTTDTNNITNTTDTTDTTNTNTTININ